MLADGTYDAIVVDAEPDADAPARTRLELTILSGEHKGEVVPVIADGLATDPIDMLGLPATLVVDSGEPRVSLER